MAGKSKLIEQAVPLADAFVILGAPSFAGECSSSHPNIIDVYPPKALAFLTELNLVSSVLT